MPCSVPRSAFPRSDAGAASPARSRRSRERTPGSERRRRALRDAPKRRPPESADILRVLAELGRHRVDYALLGGAAMALHGFPRMTKDIDLILPRSARNNARLLKALAAISGTFALDRLPDKKTLDAGLSTAAEGELGIDILFVAASKTFEDYRARIVTREIDGVPVRLLDIDGMPMSKQADRPDDIPDRRRRLRCFARLLLAHQVVVVDERVAVGDQEVGGGLLHADADHGLVVLAQLAHERREIRVAAHDHEGVDVRLGVAEVERVDHHADVGGVLARHAHVRDLDQLERSLVHGRLEFLVAVPVAVGLLHHDAALEEQALEDFADVELRVLRFANAEGDVLEVAEDRHVLGGGGSGHCAIIGRTLAGPISHGVPFRRASSGSATVT